MPTQRSKWNKRNGRGRKTVKSGLGTFDIDTPQNRQSSFEPELVRKRQTILADNLSEKIIGLSGLGKGYPHLGPYKGDLRYRYLAHRPGPDDRPYNPRCKGLAEPAIGTVVLYRMVDAMHNKVKVDGKIEHRALYNILGLNKEGYKQILGTYIS
ncbi:transposase [Maribacter sp. 2307ULW6-5]|uniref:transposase n=1 Tax=Maribacter sp. 2307ULW6-5 TaxID=3386275 RepID=UPI0039BCA11E